LGRGLGEGSLECWVLGGPGSGGVIESEAGEQCTGRCVRAVFGESAREFVSCAFGWGTIGMAGRVK
jgi:hypothetical protein